MGRQARKPRRGHQLPSRGSELLYTTAVKHGAFHGGTLTGGTRTVQTIGADAHQPHQPRPDDRKKH